MGNEQMAKKSMDQHMSTESSNKVMALLRDLEARGEAKVRELYPALNPVMMDRGPGTIEAFRVLGAVTDAGHSTLNPDETFDTVLLEDNDGIRWTFFANNKGVKAKVADLKEGEALVLLFRGTVPAKTKGHNPWADWGMISFKDVRTAKAFVEDARKAIAK